MNALNAPTTSVVLCTHASERFEDLARGLRGLAQQTCRPLETIVVVDRNPDLAARVRERWGDLVVVTDTGVGGVSAARNAGIDVARGDIVVFLDDDATPEPDWLEHLIAPYADERVVVVGGWATPDWDDRRPAHLPHDLDWLVGCSHRGTPTEQAFVRNVVGASLSVRREVALSIGGFDDRVSRRDGVPLGCDDTEFCIRAAQRIPGTRVVLEPRAVVHHRVPPARTTWTYLRARSYAEGISKAQVARMVGAGDATSDEWRYATRILPRSIVREVGAGRWRGGVAILTALLWTTWGYLAGRVRGVAR